MRVVFMGSPEFSVPALEALIEAGHEICAVYCQPPRPAGRGKKDRPTPVHARAAEFNLDVFHPVSLKTKEALQEFAALKADVAVVVAYGLILPQAILDAPLAGCLNIHASLLPRWRGAAPIHRAIMAGDCETGICIMQMDAGLDTGPVLSREAIPIDALDTTGSLHDKLSALGAAKIVETLDVLDDLTSETQATSGVTYADKVEKSEARIDWTASAVDLDRRIRGLSPFPGAWTTANDTRIKILRCRQGIGMGAPGAVLHNPLRVCCGDGAIEIMSLQRSGKGVQNVSEFLNGWSLPEGTILGGRS